MKAIILAGGKATRLQNSAKDIPKVLVEVGSKSILDWQISLLKKYGFNDIRLALGFRAEQVINHLGAKYEYIVEPEPLGTGGAIKFATADLKEPFMVLNGDILSNMNFKKFVESFQNDPKSSIALWPCSDCRDFGMVSLDKENRILEFKEKPIEKCPGLINAGYYILFPEVFKDISQKNFSVEKDVFPILTAGQKLRGFIHKGEWTDLGTEERLQEARRKFLCQQNP